jgi:UDP-3-O-acyl-N-acetylglucosamine deacetylase
MDGSAAPFVYLLLDAGIEELNSAKKFGSNRSEFFHLNSPFNVVSQSIKQGKP